MTDNYDQMEKDIMEVLGKYDATPNNYVNLMTVIGSALVSTMTSAYLKYRKVSYNDFEGLVDNYVKVLKESSMKEYKELLLTESY